MVRVAAGAGGGALTNNASNTCGSTETELKKENRMNFLHCNTCQSRRTVVSIAKGYVAQVRRRKKT